MKKSRPATAGRQAFVPASSMRSRRRHLVRTLSEDMYHLLVVASWPLLLLIFLGAYLGASVFFAGVFLLVDGSIGNAEPGSFRDAFFFSVQTLSTVGYGTMIPIGLYANLVVTLEVFVGLLGFALGTGMVFAKFSRPTARVRFPPAVVIGRHEGRHALIVRMANDRNNRILDARAQFHLVRDVFTADGEFMRRFFDLPLVRDTTPLFSMTWAAIHLIDEQSPLFGMDQAKLEEVGGQLVVSMVGMDETFVQQIYARRFYQHSEFAWNARYEDVITRDAEGQLRVNMECFDRVAPLEDGLLKDKG